MHFAGFKILARNLTWSFKTFITHSLVIESQQDYPAKAYFGNYQRISVSIEISAKCREYTLLPFRANALFFKTKLVYSFGVLHSFI